MNQEHTIKEIEEVVGYCVQFDDVYDKFDNDMIDIIYELNKKNWRTIMCCQGHPTEECDWNAFIMFENESYIPKLTDNLYYEKINNKKLYTKISKDSYEWIGTKKANKFTLEMQEKERQNLLKDILQWAKELPYNN